MNNNLGDPLPDWSPPLMPSRTRFAGNYCFLERLQTEKHGQNLWEAYSKDKSLSLWQYLPYGPFHQCDEFIVFIDTLEKDRTNVFFSVINQQTGKAIGYLAYSRILPEAGSIEIAHVCFSPELQNTTMATEAIFLLIDDIFSLGYRRCEWKCNALNQGSMDAAKRLGFQYEGCFRQASVVKGRNRDTAWFSILDSEWASLQSVYRQWLDASNFDSQGLQRTKLSDIPR